MAQKKKSAAQLQNELNEAQKYIQQLEAHVKQSNTENRLLAQYNAESNQQRANLEAQIAIFNESQQKSQQQQMPVPSDDSAE